MRRDALKVLLAVLLTLMGFAGCESRSKTTTDPNTGTLSAKLMSTGTNGERFCLKGDIVSTGGPENGSFTLRNRSCNSKSLTQFFAAGDYTATIPNPVCSVSNLPAGETFLGCTLDDPKNVPFTITAGQITPVTFHATINLAKAGPVQVVFGVGAGDFDVDADAGITKYCGSIKAGDICEDGKSYCLDYDMSGSPACYVLCDSARDCESGEYCQLVALSEGGGGESGAFNIHRGQHIDSPDEVPGVCIDTNGSGGEGGQTGSGGSGTGGTSGTTSSGGTSSGSGGTSSPPSFGGVPTTFRWDLPTGDYLPGDVTIAGFPEWLALCVQDNDEDSDPDVFQCTVGMPPGPVDFDLLMSDDQAPRKVIYYGEENFEECDYHFGGDGDVQGTLTVTVAGKELSTKLVPNSTYYNPDPNVHCETGIVNGETVMEMLTYNVRVVIPAP